MPQDELLTPPDACSAPPSFSPRRFVLFTLVFLIMLGSGVLFAEWEDRPYGIQLASQLAYTAGVILYTFSANRGMQRYLFGCPIVRPQLPRLGACPSILQLRGYEGNRTDT